MIDANSQFFATLTNVGMAKQANADALGVAWTLAQMGVGDANGTDPVPSAAQTSLINERRRRPLNQVKVDPVNPAVIITEQIIPADEGGWWIRELGLYDADGDLVAVANCAPSYKPVLAQGSGRTQVVRMNFIVASTGNITLKIDPAVVLATREYVDSRILEELYKLDSKQSVHVATTANIVLAGLQTVDGVALVAGDRVLVKNQTVAKDNGIWLAASLAWTRAADAESNAEVTSALLTSVEQGATQADTRWQLITDGAIVVGTTALTFQNVTAGFAPINAPALISPTANTPAQFDSSLLLINAAFLKRRGVEYADYTNYSASAVLTVADVGKVAAFASATSGAMVATLPSGGLIPRGAVVEVLCGQGSVTVTAAAGEIIDAVNYVGNIAMGLGDTALFIRIGTLWRLIGGSVSLRYSAVMSGAFWATPPQFDASTKLATMEAVQRALGNKRLATSISSSRAITLADFGGDFVVSSVSPVTLTLPSAATVANGASLRLVNLGSGTCTLARTGADAFIGSFNSGGAATSFSLLFNDDVTVTAYGGLWLVVGAGAMSASTTGTSGFRYIGGGLIEQWGDVTGPANPANGRWDFDVVFPTAFPNACLSVVGGAGISTADLDASDGAGGTYRANKTNWQVGVPLPNKFEASVWYTDVPNNVRHFSWRAIGK
jgi:hypothetical protein